MSKGGSSPPTNSTVTQTTTNLPEYAQPYYMDMMNRAAYQTSLDYQPYQGQRLAYFSPMEQEAMARMGEMGVSGDNAYLTQAAQMAGQAGQTFNPNISSNAASSYRAGSPSNIQFDQMSRQSGYTAGQRDMGYTAGQRDTGYTANQLGPEGYYTAGSRDSGFEPGSLANSDMLAQYMSPYYQQVVDVQKREAARQADIRNQDIANQASTQGGLGGYRDAILRAENERNLQQQMSDIQAQGSQAAFTNAQQAYEADRAARAQQEQFLQSQFGLNQQSAQYAAQLMQQGFSANEAARQAQEQFGQSQFQMNEAARQQMEQFGQTQFQANEAARQQMEQYFQSQFGMNAQQAQYAAGIELQKYQASEQAKQAAAQLGLSAAQINQAGQIAAAQIMLGQQQNTLGAAQLMGNLSGQQQAMEMDRLNQMMQAGGMERGLLQQGLDIGYQDYLRQQGYPLESISFMSNLLQGNAMTPGSTTAVYGQQPSYGQQLLGSGIAGLGLYNAFNPGG